MRLPPMRSARSSPGVEAPGRPWPGRRSVARCRRRHLRRPIRIASSTLSTMSGAIRTGAAAPPVGSSTPWRSRRASAKAVGVSGQDRLGKAPDPFRGLAPARDPARRRDVEDHGPDDPIRAGGPAQHQPVARRDRERSREPDDRRRRPVGKLERVAAAATDARVRRRGPEMDAQPRAVRQRRAEPDEDAVARDDRRVIGQDQAPMQVGDPHASDVQRRPPGLSRLDAGAVDLDLADADGPVARHEPERRASERAVARAASRSRRRRGP